MNQYQDIMISIKAIFGSNNRYHLDVPDDTELGYLAYYLTVPLKLSPEDVLYVICNGQLVQPDNYDKKLYELGLVHDTCDVHMIFSSEDSLPADRVLSKCNGEWIKRAKRNVSAQVSSDGMQQIIGQIMMGLGEDGQTFTFDMQDEEIHLAPEEYGTYIRVHDEIPEDQNCTICSDPITEGQVATVRRCGHHFHDDCIRPYMLQEGARVNCPTCGQDVRDLE